jgi:hypothetical protein
MSNVYEAFETDNELAADGVWLDVYTPEGEPIAKFKCRPADGDMNPAYRAAAAALLERMRRDKTIDGDGIDATVALYAETVIVDWEGVTNRDGKKIPFTAKACAELMRDLPQLFKAIQQQARDWTKWRTVYREELAGN